MADHNRTQRLESTKKLVGLALLAAIVALLQLLGSFIRIGPFPISLVLIPIVIGAAIYGPGGGAFLGGVFGLIVTIATVNGTDQGAYVMFVARPFVTVALCMLKGIAAGWVAGLAYRAVSGKNQTLAVLLAAVLCPITNTGIFCAAMLLFYFDILQEWAGGTNVVAYMLFTLAGVNFLIETALNLVVSSVIVRIVNIWKKA
ncbi:MAG: ECF transporter S component [Clostridiales bacterium]|jgi:uncharacterized membrane protein|nr:ECF transporter S component [Clostridiales bacterium]